MSTELEEKLTREKILEMPAGREMDALVAYSVFGLPKRCLHKEVNVVSGTLIECRSCSERFGKTTYALSKAWLRPYSTSISDAWAVVEKMRPLMLKLQNGNSPNEWTAIFFDKHSWEGEVERNGSLSDDYAAAPTAPLAICRAALLATLNK